MRIEPIAAGFFQSLAQGIPTSAEPSTVILWALGGVLFLLSVLAGVVKLLDSRRETERTKFETERTAYIAKLETKLETSQATVATLGARLDDERKARDEDQKRMARLLFQIRGDVSVPGSYELDEDFDIPTGVHEILKTVPTPEHQKRLDAQTEARLRNFDPYHSTAPPESLPKPPNLPRTKLRSRPDR